MYTLILRRDRGEGGRGRGRGGTEGEMEDEEGKKRGGKRRAERVGGGRRGDYCIALRTFLGIHKLCIVYSNDTWLCHESAVLISILK